MSASAWSKCPKCAKLATEKLIAREEKVTDSYGKVPAMEFIASMEQLELDRKKAENMDATLREDYHVTGAEDGVVTFTYSAGCKVCGLNVNRFVVERPIFPTLDAPVLVPSRV